MNSELELDLSDIESNLKKQQLYGDCYMNESLVSTRLDVLGSLELLLEQTKISASEESNLSSEFARCSHDSLSSSVAVQTTTRCLEKKPKRKYLKRSIAKFMDEEGSLRVLQYEEKLRK